MKTSTLVWTVVAIIVLIGGWYWWSGTQNPATSPVETQTSAENVQTPVTTTTNTTTFATSSASFLNVNSDSTLGQYLAASNGMTLYSYSKDTTGVSNCSGTCASNWPPYTVSTDVALRVAPGVTGAVGAIKRADGTTQMTYKGMPLYFWVQDTKINDVTGNTVGGFTVVKP